ncbi:MAG: translation initiation factor IF-2 [Chloroflexota bacterium]|nr:translation initiation factor IF-2 [Chloroflexota bacterium]
MAQEKQLILVPDFLTVREVATLIDASPIDVMKRLIANGIMASINQQVDYETAAIVLEEMGFEAQSASAAAAKAERERMREQTTQVWRKVYDEEKRENLTLRPPIVTILGHVDHGKTTLLDTIRKAHVADGEAGGITQHIGAYRVMHNGKQITFLDTPGHEAFTQMRARGAQGADIVILVVAADDGVMQTTREAIAHARAANVPIIVAITKTDKRNANIERVKQQLTENGLTPMDWDGDTFVVPVAAIKGDGIDDILEAITLVADDHDITANPLAGFATGTVLEAEIDKHKGVIATMLVFNGTLKRGDVVIAGNAYGKIKAMFDEKGKQVKEALPSMPVAVLGLHTVPKAGDTFDTMDSDKEARTMASDRQDAAQTALANVARPVISLEEIFAQYRKGGVKELNMVLKVDVQGSLQPIVDQLKLIEEGNKEGIKLRLLAADTGNISESDVMLASASGAIVIGFNVDADNASKRAAEMQGVEIRHYDIIYKLFEDVELALQGMLEPVYANKTIGTAEVRALFRVPRIGTIAGCMVLDGEIRRNARVRVLRGSTVLGEDLNIGSLKRMQEDVREVRGGFECGIGVANFDDFKEGDRIECYISERVS